MEEKTYKLLGGSGALNVAIACRYKKIMLV